MKVTHGSATVRYYPTPVNGYESWTVVWRTKAGRGSKRFPVKVDAVKFAKNKAQELAEGYHFAITAEDRASIARATELIKPTGKPLELVCGEYAEMHRLTKASPIELARFWNLHQVESPKTASEVSTELIKARKAEGCSDAHVRDLESKLPKFAAAFTCKLNEIPAPQISDWLQHLKDKDGEPLSPKSRKNYRIAISNLFTFAKARRYLPKAWDEMSSVPVPRVPKAQIEIYTPTEMRALITAARKSIIPYLVISGFGGLRQAEVQRLLWEDIKLEERKILVRERVQSVRNKTGKRTVPIQPNLYAWLVDLKGDKKSGPVIEIANMANPLCIAGEKVGGWRHNAPRHSFISYRVAEVKRIEEVAHEAGNSKRIIQTDYLEVEMPDGRLIGEKEAREWFSIMPE